MHIVSATAVGSAHVNPGQPGKTNNQDAVARRDFSRGSVVTLCDGCGTQPHSETGADIGANLIARILVQHLNKTETNNLDWPRITSQIAAELGNFVLNFTASNTQEAYQRAIIERFLFTSIAAIVEMDSVFVAAFGDGIVIIDDEVLTIESPLPNSPPYLGYLLLKDTPYNLEDNLKKYLQFLRIEVPPLSDLKKGLIIGTDGLKELADEARLEDLHHPTIIQSKFLQRWLNAQTREKIEDGVFTAGASNDDVSLVIIRTNKCQQALIEERRGLAEIKQEIARIKTLIEAAMGKYSTPGFNKQEARREVRLIREKLALAASRAEGKNILKKSITQLNRDIEDLYALIRRQSKPRYVYYPSRPDRQAPWTNHAEQSWLEKLFGPWEYRGHEQGGGYYVPKGNTPPDPAFPELDNSNRRQTPISPSSGEPALLSPDKPTSNKTEAVAEKRTKTSTTAGDKKERTNNPGPDSGPENKSFNP